MGESGNKVFIINSVLLPRINHSRLIVFGFSMWPSLRSLRPAIKKDRKGRTEYLFSPILICLVTCETINLIKRTIVMV